MKVFISSLITGMEDYRIAAKEAISQLKHEPVMAEDFGARPNSPQVACLDGLRQSGLVILIAGSTYGTKQSSGISATHEEYREAKKSHPVIAFVQGNVKPDSEQKEFIKEVQSWHNGLFRGTFDTPEKLKASITLAIHEWQLSTASTPLNVDELVSISTNTVLEEQKSREGRGSLIFSVVGGPLQSILRPTEIEKPGLADQLLQAALFGSNKIFSTNTGTKRGMEKDSLILEQEERTRMIKIDGQGTMVFRLKLSQSRTGVVVIDQLQAQIIAVIKYADWLLDSIDPTQRITHVVLAVAFSDGNILIQSEDYLNSNQSNFILGYRMDYRNNQPILLKPPHRPRAALMHEAKYLAEDLVTLLKRGLDS